MKYFHQHPIIEYAITILLTGTLVLFLNPTQLLMPMDIQMMLIIGLIITFLTFIALVWKEQSHDEREDLHKQTAGRIGFLSGAVVLTTGIIWQSIQHEIDPWIVIALIIMVLSKTLARLYVRLRK